MKIDKKLAGLLSDFFLDISKAYFIGTFITPVINKVSFPETLVLLTRGLISVILYLILAWILAKEE